MSMTQIEICCRALARCGAEDIASFDDDSEEARICKREYEPTVVAALTMPGGTPYRWRFAAKQLQLSQLQDTPTNRWRYGFQEPADCLMLYGVLRGHQPVRYDRYSGMIYCDEEGPLYADYAYRVEERLWPAYFVEALTSEMATKIAIGLYRDTDLAKVQGQLTSWGGARRADSQEQTARRIRGTRLLAARYSC